MWLLKKALYGLRVAPKRWGIKRDCTMKSMKVRVGHRDAELIQCITAKGLWKIMIDDEVIGHLIVYVDDVLVTAPTEVIHAVMESFRKEWGVQARRRHS